MAIIITIIAVMIKRGEKIKTALEQGKKIYAIGAKNHRNITHE